MARQFDVKNQSEQNKVQNNEPMTTKQMLMGIGSILIIILGIFYIIVKGKIADKEAATELAQAEKERLEYEQEMADAEDSYDEFMNNSEGQNLADEVMGDSDESLHYAFDIHFGNEVFGLINGLAVQQKDLMRTYDYCVSEGYDIPDIGCVLTDTFDYNSEGKVINYHTQNKFYLDYYDEYIYHIDSNSNSNSVYGIDGTMTTGIVDISILSSDWYYDLTEPTEDVLSRLFGWSPDESMFHLQSRLKDSKSIMYDSSMNVSAAGQLAYLGIEKDNPHYCNSYPNWYVSYQCHGYDELFGNNSDSEMFKQLCCQVDDYNRLRMQYLFTLVSNIKNYIGLYSRDDASSFSDVFGPEDYVFESSGYMIPNRRDTWMTVGEFKLKFPDYEIPYWQRGVGE